DTRQVLLPLLPHALHPGVLRLTELFRNLDGPLGPLRLIEMTFRSPAVLGEEANSAGPKLSFPGWDILRTVGGEIAEVSAFAAGEEVLPEEPVLLAGRFERGGLFQVTVVPRELERHWQFTLVGSGGRAGLTFPQDWPGPARLRWRDQSGRLHDETW